MPARGAAPVPAKAPAVSGEIVRTAPPAPKKAETVVVAAVPPPAPTPAPPPPPPSKRGLKILTETLAILLFFAVTAIPLARLGLVPLDAALQTDLLVFVGAALIGTVALFRAADYRIRVETDLLSATRRRDDAFLSTLAIASGVLLTVILVVETIALLVYLKVIQGTNELVVVAASHFILFATFALLATIMLLLARTSFHSRFKTRAWHEPVAVALLVISFVILALTGIKNHGMLGGFLQGIKADQSPYLLLLATFFQLAAYRLILRYPSVTQVFVSNLETARRANRELRQSLERRALTAYALGIVFILVSFILVGGVATGNVAKGNNRDTNLILVGYVAFAIIAFLLIVARYVQQRFLRDREKRLDSGDVVAKRRMSREQMADLVTYSLSGFFAFVLLVLSALTFLEKVPLDPKFGTDFLIGAFLVGVGPFGFRRAMRMRRVRAMDDKFPDFLRDLAEGLRAGMTLPRALYASSKGVYGALTPEIKHMSAQVEWGISFSESLQRFSDRVQTPLIGRTVSLIIEASKAGGNVVDILTAASNDAREIKMILEDRRRQMGIYSVIIYVAFFVFLVVIYVLAAQFLPSFENAVQGASGQQVGGLNFQAFDTKDYVQLFFHAGLIQGIGSGLVAGVMSEGHPLGGLKHSFVMTIVAWVFFRGLL